MKQTVKATIFSLGGGPREQKEEITLVSQESQNHFIAEYKGNRYRTLRMETSEFVLVLDSTVGEKQKVLAVRPDGTAFVYEIYDHYDLSRLLQMCSNRSSPWNRGHPLPPQKTKMAWWHRQIR